MTHEEIAAPEAVRPPRAEVLFGAEAPFPGKGDVLPAEDDTAPDYPLVAYMRMAHQEMMPDEAEVQPDEPTPAVEAGPYPGAIEAAPEEVPAEIAHEQDLTRIAVLAALTPEEIKAMTEEERALVREHIVRALEEATTVEARVKIYARVMDVYMVDTLIGFIFPEVGDIATAVAATAYLLWEADNADLTTIDRWKIFGLQALDAAVGLIPGADLILDTVFPANVLTARLFTQQVKKLAENARAAGVPDEVVQKILKDAELMQEKVDFVFKLWKIFTGGEEKDAKPNKAAPDKKVPTEPVYMGTVKAEA